MKKIVLGSAALLLALSTNASAYSLYEEFLGGTRDGNFVTMAEKSDGQWEWDLADGVSKSVFKFNLGAITPGATVDETGFGAGYQILSANLNFTVSSKDWLGETVKVKTGGWDGKQVIFEEYFELGEWSWKKWSWKKQYADISIDLFDLGLGGYLQDGKFKALFFAVESCNCVATNDFYLDHVSLNAEAEPVPEPGTMLLMGAGLAGLAGYSRKRSRKS